MPAKERALVGDIDDDEATQRQLWLARAQGDAYGAALEELALLHHRRLLEQRVGDFRISSLVSSLGPPGSEPDVWFSLFIRDVGDGRFVPCLSVEATLLWARDGGDGRDGPHRQAITWHPTAYHYGRAWRLRGEGPHRFLVHIAPAPFSFSGAGPMPEFEAVSLEIPLTRCGSSAQEDNPIPGGGSR